MIEAEAVIHRDPGTVVGFAEELTVRYSEGIASLKGDAKAALEAQAPKRVAIQFRPVRTASWDHSKLGGSYDAAGEPLPGRGSRVWARWDDHGSRFRWPWRRRCSRPLRSAHRARRLASRRGSSVSSLSRAPPTPTRGG